MPRFERWRFRRVRTEDVLCRNHQGSDGAGIHDDFAASGAGVAEDLRAELLHSQPMLLPGSSAKYASMFSKAYRWVAEMEEIASFVRAQPEAEDLFTAAAGFYSRLRDRPAFATFETLSQFFVQEN